MSKTIISSALRGASRAVGTKGSSEARGALQHASFGASHVAVALGSDLKLESSLGTSQLAAVLGANTGLESEASKPAREEVAAVQGVHSWPVIESKRQLVDLNAAEDPGLDEEIAAAGGYRSRVVGYGSHGTEQGTLTAVKELLREGKVCWLNGEVRGEHLANAKWISQTCRMAHRAGIPWALRVKAERPWRVPELCGLRKLRYVSEKRISNEDGVHVLLTSDIVDIDAMSRAGFYKAVSGAPKLYENGTGRD